MIKVMQVIHGLSTGGAETLVKDYSLVFDKNKINIVVLCFTHCNNSPYERLLEENNVKVIYVEDYQRFFNKKGILFKIFNRLQKYYLVRRIIHKEKPDIIHSHLPINNYIKFSKPQKGTRIIHTVHSEPKRYWPIKNRDFKAALYLVKKYNMRFICLHDRMKKEVDKMFGVNNSIVLNNGINVKKYKQNFSKDKIRNELGVPKDAFIIGHIGRYNKIKNHEFIVRLFNEIMKKNRNSYLLLIGTGEEKNKIYSLIKELSLIDHCIMLENRSDIPDLLHSMDVFILPSIKEGVPLSMIEAQEARIPCFISEGVSDESIISNLVTKKSLEDGANAWAKEILNYKIPKSIIIDDIDWNIESIVKKLELLYEEEVSK